MKSKAMKSAEKLDGNVDVDAEDPLSALRRWIAEGRLPEIVPTQQDRSLRTTLAMVEAGRSLLRDRSLEDLSVEMVCRAAGTTVGAFYGRFETSTPSS
jgi:Bacterial regulatory proteins, tetR family.